MAQRILSPLRLPFRHIGAVRWLESKRFVHPTKMNFAVADAHRGNGKRFIVRTDAIPLSEDNALACS
jgi:hypothetical protein